MTQETIKKFQTAIALLGHSPGKVDGIWGPKTSTAANSLRLNGPRDQSWSSVRDLQDVISESGYDVGPLDGLWGAKTAQGLASFSAARGVPKASSLVFTEPPCAREDDLIPNTQKVLLQGSAGHVIDTIMLHTSATPGSWIDHKTNKQMLEEIREWHLDRQWSDIGYHLVCFPDGEKLAGRPASKIGAGCIGRNRGVYHICMIPIKTITKMGTPEDFYTSKQIDCVKSAIEHISEQTPIKEICGHNEYANKLCPGFPVRNGYWTDRKVK